MHPLYTNVELTPKEEIHRRIDALRKSMVDAGVDFSVILQNVDMFYFTGTVQKGVLVVPLERDPLFFVEKSVDRAKHDTPLDITPIENDKAVKDVLRRAKILKGTGGMELDVLPASAFERFKRIVGYEKFMDIGPLIKVVRSVKSPFELRQLKKSAQIMEHVFARAPGMLREGATELEIDAELIAEGRKHGHQGFLRMRGFNQEMTTITVVAGQTGAVPSPSDVAVGGLGLTPAVPLGSSSNVIRRNMPVSIDYGGGYNGYVTDETYVFVIGEIEEVFRRPYEVSRQIIEDAAVFGKEGVDAAQLFKRAHRMAEAARLDEYLMGYGEGKVSFIGHGLGLEINELPVITPRHHITLKEGMVFAFEPKFTLPGKGAIGMEVDFIVRKDRLERLTDISLDLVYV